MNPISVLFVDDEINVLSGLRRMLRTHRAQWNMEYVLGGPLALERIRTEQYDVVISDMKMPDVDGVQVLQEVKRSTPSALRCVLSGQADREQTHRVLSSAHQFVSKPCDADMLEAVIQKAQILKAKLPGKELKQLVSRIDNLPSTPQNYAALMELVESPNASIERIADVVTSDLAMSAKVLQLVCNSFFAHPYKTNSPRSATKLLGLDIMRELAMKSKIFRPFEQALIPGFSIQDLTEHSIEVAKCAHAIALSETQDPLMADEAFVAGLLHDIGKIVLADQATEKYRDAVDLANHGGMTLWQSEIHVFETSHTEVGSYLLALWGLPHGVVDAVASYRDPNRCGFADNCSTNAVHVANILKRRNCSSHLDVLELAAKPAEHIA